MTNKAKKAVDGVVKHQIFLRRYSGGLFKEMSGFITQSIKTTSIWLTKNEIRLTMFNKARVNTVLKYLESVNTQIMSQMTAKTQKRLLDLTVYETNFNKKLLHQTVSGVNTLVPTIRQIKASAFTNILSKTIGWSGKAKTISDTLTSFSSKTVGSVLEQVREGFLIGTPILDIVKNIQNSSGIAYRDALSIARTSVNHVSSQARLEFYKENSDIIESYQVVATLDDRLSDICEELDGQIFAPEDFEEPPYHWNCRSTFIGVVDSKYSIGDITSVERPDNRT